MRPASLWLILFPILYFPLSLRSQNDSRISIQLNGGISLPIGSYASANAEKAALYDPNVAFDRVLGFSKKNNGFAKLGNNYGIEINFKTSKNLLLFASASRFSNSVATKSLTLFLTELFGEEEFIARDYHIFSLTSGVGNFIHLNKCGLAFFIFLGYAQADFPYYERRLVYTNLTPPPIFAHEGSEPTLKSLALGSRFTFMYKLSSKFSLGIDASYFATNFQYSMNTRLIPGGSQSFQFDDELKVRVINVAVKLGYSLK